MRDFDRPLKGRGRDAAKLIGKKLATEELSAPVVICSPAARTRETAKIVLRHSGLNVEERFDERIYEASLGDLLRVVSEIPEEEQIAIMIGHNPGLEELLAFLTGDGRRMPTCALAKIRLDVESWKDVKADAGEVESFMKPKDLDED